MRERSAEGNALRGDLVEEGEISPRMRTRGWFCAGAWGSMVIVDEGDEGATGGGFPIGLLWRSG